jgi:hypothetical protein
MKIQGEEKEIMKIKFIKWKKVILIQIKKVLVYVIIEEEEIK